MDAAINTIERIIPEQVNPSDITGKATLDLHLKRYQFAAKYAKHGRILDIACGVGYGTYFLTENGKDIVQAVGVDISGDAIEYAKSNYANQRIIFQEHDAMTFTDEKGFDFIVSVETLEHIPDPNNLVKRLYGMLRLGGIIIASVPTTPSIDVNPYHLHDFTEHSFRRMMKKYALREVSCFHQIQPYPIIKTLKREESRMKDMRQNLLSYYSKHPNAAMKRILATLRYGFTNRYITIAWQKQE